ncbi:alpha-1,2-mannosidase [Paenibacillus rhizovicinus]|uniref:Alpha-1,2-mannosidase n=1 Tax=Paenibacillus rhizovicinus TaxID=2704463 RepID=A0A6C0NXU1_9BACL|nr:GH92 family glycosyl hydrolase [Paenibacillus rhizovicinus]QHW31019.1 alpha-1,2-mannosidase [Paenibacillus rhizovicinus]
MIHESAAVSVSEYVNTRRGSNSDPSYSKGNTFPATGVPFGFNFWTPMTNASEPRWIYQYSKSGIQAFTISHMPSPWIGDRQTFQFMPMSDQVTVDRDAREASFDHANETAKAHVYSVKFDNGIQTELAPTDHAACVRFSFPTDRSYLLFDTFDNLDASIAWDEGNGVVTGHVDYPDGFLRLVPRMYVYAEFSKPFVRSSKVEGYRDLTSWVEFDTVQDRQVTMKIATSFISVEQAKANLLDEIGSSTFEQVKLAAQDAWDAILNKIEVEGASEEQLITLYSNLYRLFIYPNSAYEHVGGKPQYATPYVKGNPIKEGKLYVNNGFWDTYRTTWPMYALLTPDKAGELAEGFLKGYKDGGWMARWSAPGCVDCMVGTNSDVIFADAYLKGITGFDAEAAYDSMIRNAATYSSDSSKGRKGMERSVFLGYTPQDHVGESTSWSLESYLNDFGIAQLATALGKEDDAKYFYNRALNYVHIFSPSVGFFRGKNEDGSWRTSDEEFSSIRWGSEYTEGNAWHYCVAVPHDGQGLANLYGGREGLSDKIDDVFNAPRDYEEGGYGFVIHEMVEAYDIDRGQYGHSNQPVHHTIYMYNYAGTPWKTQARARDIVTRLYDSGVGTGNGYQGDEDNGEMSAWYLFAAMGFYPVSVGRPEYAIGAPYFKKMTIHLENGKDIVIHAPKVNDDNIYVQGLKMNGQDHSKNYFLHRDLADGALLEFDMGPSPSSWGSGKDDVPPSLTTGELPPQPLQDLANGGKVTASGENEAAGNAAAQAFVNNSSTKWQTSGATGWIQYELKEAGAVQMYTITSANDGQQQDPKSWELLASNDGTHWSVLDARTDEAFAWRQHTRAFAMNQAEAFTFYRLHVKQNHGADSLQIAEIELLG